MRASWVCSILGRVVYLNLKTIMNHVQKRRRTEQRRFNLPEIDEDFGVLRYYC